MTEMFDAWWHANRFEFVMAGGLMVMIALGTVAFYFVDLLKKRRERCPAGISRCICRRRPQEEKN